MEHLQLEEKINQLIGKVDTLMGDVDELKHDLIERKARGKFIATVLKFGGPVLIWVTVVIEAIRLKHGLK